jgi:hypothetical protein
MQWSPRRGHHRDGVRKDGAGDVQEPEDVRREDGLDLGGRCLLHRAEQTRPALLTKTSMKPNRAMAASTAATA